MGAFADGPAAPAGLTADRLLQLVLEDGRLRLPRRDSDGSLAWSPDGRYLFYTVRPRREQRSRPHIVKLDTNSGATYPFAAASFVVFSPDGSRVAFGDDSELKVAEVGPDYALHGTRSVAVERSGALGAFRVPSIAWSPDSTRVTFVSITESVQDAADPPNTRYPRLFELRVLDVPSDNQQTLLQVSGLAGGIGSVQWSAHDQLLITSGTGDPTEDARTQIAHLDVSTKTLSTLVENPGVIVSGLRPLRSPDHKWLSYWRDYLWTPPVQLGFGLALKSLSEDDPSARVPHALYADGPIQWRPGSSHVYFTCKSNAFATNLCVIDAETMSSVDVRSLRPTEDIEWFSMSPDGRSLAWRSRDAYDVERIRTIDLGTGVQRLVAEEALLPPELAKAAVEPVAWHGFDGLRIAGLLVKPLGYVPGRRYPLIVDVHGGPNGGIRTAGSLLNATPLEWQLWAALGYAVLVADYRESGIYAPDNRHLRRATGRYLFDENSADIVAGARYVVDLGIADPDRLAILGHSHGSSVTNWLLTRTHCFAAAVSKEGRTDWRWMRPGWESLYRYYFASGAAQLPEVLARHSALEHSSRIQTPLLYINGQYGLGVDEGQQFVAALQRQGIDARWLSLPNEGHVIQSAENVRRMLSETLQFLRSALEVRRSTPGSCDVSAVLREPFAESDDRQ